MNDKFDIFSYIEMVPIKENIEPKPSIESISQRQIQTNILNVHYRFDTDRPSDYIAIFKKLRKSTIQIIVYALQNDQIPKLTFRITGGPQRIISKNTKYPIELQYDDIYLVLPNTTFDSCIPRRIIQTHRSDAITSEMKIIQKALCEMNPEYEYLFFNDERCNKFINKYFNKYIIHAYDLLLPGAYKSDLFRYCYLYVHGGIYIDFKTVPQVPLHTFIYYKTPLVMVHDMSPISICNIFMATASKNPFFEYAIRTIARQIFNKNIGEHLYDITGNVALGKAYNKYLNKPEDTPTDFKQLPHVKILKHIYENNEEKNTVIQNLDKRTLMYKVYSTYYTTHPEVKHWEAWINSNVFKETQLTDFDYEWFGVIDSMPLLSSLQVSSFSPELYDELSPVSDLRFASDVQSILMK